MLVVYAWLLTGIQSPIELSNQNVRYLYLLPSLDLFPHEHKSRSMDCAMYMWTLRYVLYKALVWKATLSRGFPKAWRNGGAPRYCTVIALASYYHNIISTTYACSAHGNTSN